MTKAPLKLILLSAALVIAYTPWAFSAEILTGQPLVILYPGHNKNNPGLGNESGPREFSATLTLAQHLATALSDTCRVHIARPSNDAEPDETAPALANRKKADLFISLHIHSNASAQPTVFYYDTPEADGTDTWQNLPLRSQAGSKKLATAMANAMKAHLPGTRPLVLSAPILSIEGTSMPGILIEPFALSQIPVSPDKKNNFFDDRTRPMADAVRFFLMGNRPGD